VYKSTGRPKTELPLGPPKPISDEPQTIASAELPDNVRKDIVQVISRLIQLIDAKDFFAMKELSDHTIHNASIYQDEDSVNIAVLVYALFKICDREKELPDKFFLLRLKNAYSAIMKADFENYRASVKRLFSMISGRDSRIKMFMEEVVQQAKIKKGMKLVEHGISAERSAQVMGVSQWELMEYLGKTQSSEVRGRTNVDDRIMLTKKIFRIKS